MIKNNTTKGEPVEEKKQSPAMNRRTRRALKRTAPKPVHKDNKKIYSDKVVYTDDSYKDKSKRVFSHGLKGAKERIAAMTATFKLPESIKTTRHPQLSTAILINHDGKARDFLPDIPPTRKLLVHGSVAKAMVAGVCMLTRPTANYTAEGKWIDGSWAITPAEYRMMNVTTIQHVRRRPWWFLRRYWYEISFDGRVNPAHMLNDYEIDPTAPRTKFYITTETVKVKNSEQVNTYFRFWRNRP